MTSCQLCLKMIRIKIKSNLLEKTTQVNSTSHIMVIQLLLACLQMRPNGTIAEASRNLSATEKIKENA